MYENDHVGFPLENEYAQGITGLSIKDIVKDNSVYFVFYRQQHMYYGVDVNGQKLLFPVPLSDIMDASLFAEEKAITYMRYIRKAMADGTLIPQNG